MKHVAKLLALALATTGGTFIALEAPAFAYPHCERNASKPTFDGHNISGKYSVTCSRSFPRATLYGRLKKTGTTSQTELDTESVTFTNTKSSHVKTTDCNDGDDIYTEAQINDESSTASSRANMTCD